MILQLWQLMPPLSDKPLPVVPETFANSVVPVSSVPSLNCSRMGDKLWDRNYGIRPETEFSGGQMETDNCFFPFTPKSQMRCLNT